MKIYLAGRIDGISIEEAYNWRNSLIDISPNEWRFFVPKDVDDAPEGINADKYFIKNSDIFVVKIDKTPSWGTAMETMFASMLGKLIIAFTLEDIEIYGWIKHMSFQSLKVKNVGEVLDCLKSLEDYER